MCFGSLKCAQRLCVHHFHVNLAAPWSAIQPAASQTLSSSPVGFRVDTLCPQLHGDSCACGEPQQTPVPHLYSSWSPCPLLNLPGPLPHTPRSRIAYLQDTHAVTSVIYPAYCTPEHPYQLCPLSHKLSLRFLSPTHLWQHLASSSYPISAITGYLLRSHC